MPVVPILLRLPFAELILDKNKDEPNLLDVISPNKYTILPNTAGCFDADSAVRTCMLARELLDGHNLVKLEVLGDEKKPLSEYHRNTKKAAKVLIDDGFEVMVYTSDDPIVAKELESMGCVAIMPLGSLIGSGLGILNRHTLSLIIEQTKVPVLVDAGVGTASDAAIAMELGCDGVLMNTAIAHAKKSSDDGFGDEPCSCRGSRSVFGRAYACTPYGTSKLTADRVLFFK